MLSAKEKADWILADLARRQEAERKENMSWLFNRIFVNKNTTIQGLAPGLAAALAAFGFNMTTDQIIAVFTIVYAIVKLLQKDPVTK